MTSEFDLSSLNWPRVRSMAKVYQEAQKDREKRYGISERIRKAYEEGYKDCFIEAEVKFDQLKSEVERITGMYEYAHDSCIALGHNLSEKDTRILELETQVERLKIQRDDFEKDFRNNYKWRCESNTKIDQLNKHNGELTEALRFYADPTQYGVIESVVESVDVKDGVIKMSAGPTYRVGVAVVDDQGKRARSALGGEL